MADLTKLHLFLLIFIPSCFSGTYQPRSTPSQPYKPSPQEELLARLLIRTLVKQETTFREFLPYELALVRSPTPLFIRSAFHMNTVSSDGCLDQNVKFNAGLQNVTDHIDAYYQLYATVYSLIQEVHQNKNSTGYDGTNFSKAAESECKRRNGNPVLCIAQCDTVEEQATNDCIGKLHLWNRDGWRALIVERIGDDLLKSSLLRMEIRNDSTEDDKDILAFQDVIFGFYNHVYREADPSQIWDGKVTPKINQADLNELFPSFEPSKPLRFLTLFEHTQTNGYPNPYRWMTNVRRRNNKEKRSSISGSGFYVSCKFWVRSKLQYFLWII